MCLKQDPTNGWKCLEDRERQSKSHGRQVYQDRRSHSSNVEDGCDFHWASVTNPSILFVLLYFLLQKSQHCKRSLGFHMRKLSFRVARGQDNRCVWDCAAGNCTSRQEHDCGSLTGWELRFNEHGPFFEFFELVWIVHLTHSETITHFFPYLQYYGTNSGPNKLG